MGSSRGVHTCACAVGMAVVVWQTEARTAEETPPPTEPLWESVRVDMGLGLMGATNAGAGIGTLGIASIMPMASLALEAHMSGPAWFVISARGGYSEQMRDDDTESGSWLAALRIGPRLEWPVVDRVEAGGYLLVTGSMGSYLYDYNEGADRLSIGGVLGGSIHFRATPLFGVRLGLDLVSAGYFVESSSETVTRGYAELSPSPSLELTFTF